MVWYSKSIAMESGDSMRTVVVTGAGSGIGLALVKHYAKRGHTVYATKLASQDVDYAAENVTYFDVDFLKDDGCAWLESVNAPIDIFVANAGAGKYEKNTVPSPNDAMYRLNTLTPIEQFYYLKEKGFSGTFVVMGSIMALWPLAGYARFSHTKGALVTYFKALQVTETIPIVIMLPVAVQTQFFTNSRQAHAPWLAQKPDRVSKKMAKVIERKKRVWISSRLFAVLYKISPRILRFYQKRENRIYHETFHKEKNRSDSYE